MLETRPEIIDVIDLFVCVYLPTRFKVIHNNVIVGRPCLLLSTIDPPSLRMQPDKNVFPTTQLLRGPAPPVDHHRHIHFSHTRSIY